MATLPGFRTKYPTCEALLHEIKNKNTIRTYRYIFNNCMNYWKIRKRKIIL